MFNTFQATIALRMVLIVTLFFMGKGISQPILGGVWISLLVIPPNDYDSVTFIQNPIPKAFSYLVRWIKNKENSRHRVRSLEYFSSRNSPNHVILAYRLLEASIMGFSFFLLLTIYNLHKYIREVVLLADTIMATRKQNKVYEDIKKKSADEAKFIKNEISKLKTESECNIKEQQVESKKAHYNDVKISLEGSMVEYDCLLADNKDLRDQPQDINERWSCQSAVPKKKIRHF